MYTFCVSTDQCEVVVVDFPDQTGLFAIPLLYVHHLPILYFYNGLQGTERQTWLLYPSVHTTLHYPVVEVKIFTDE